VELTLRLSRSVANSRKHWTLSTTYDDIVACLWKCLI